MITTITIIVNWFMFPCSILCIISAYSFYVRSINVLSVTSAKEVMFSPASVCLLVC